MTDQSELYLEYSTSEAVMDQVLKKCSAQGFSIHDFSVNRKASQTLTAAAEMRVVGRGSIEKLALAIGGIDGVISVRTLNKRQE